MHITDTELAGAHIVDLERLEDERGFFARSFCQREFDKLGMTSLIVQSNVSFNKFKGTVRGMHYQVAPALETKLVRCTRGSILDVIVDMREDSPTFKKHVSIQLDADNHRALFVPADFAHGFLTLEDDTEVMYMVSGFYTPDCERGLRHDDPALGIDWPVKALHISEKDARWPLL
jgi:dTDP-4-dehydrorhamnose 3,5-epimerase